MFKNQDGTYIYLTVPAKYNCVYQKLLVKLADLGIDMVKDCGATCRGINRHVINCWNMFQAACSAYALGEEKKADLLINYINGQLKLSCPEYCTEEEEHQTPEMRNWDIPNTLVTKPGAITLRSSFLTFNDISLFKPNSLDIGANYSGNGNIELPIKENCAITNNPDLGGISFMMKSGINEFIAQAQDLNGNTVKVSFQRIIPSAINSNNYYGVGTPSGSIPVNAFSSTDDVWTWDKPGKTNDIYIAYPRNKQITNLTSNPDTIPDVNLYDKIKDLGSKEQITINDVPYVLEIVHSGAYFNYPLKITIG